MNQTELGECIAFVQRAENLKNTLRSAYTSTGRQESTAEHTWRLCLLVMVFSQHLGEADLNKLLRLAVIHDLGEAVCGDVPAICQSEKNDKSASERKGMCDLCAGLPEATRSEFLALWDEYEAATTLEAKIIKSLDKLETIIQHNQGENPPDFDYDFNLAYGREHTSALPLLGKIRELLDETTQEKSRAARDKGL
ncbi:HD domain-containing protein [Desulfosarcina sp. OttesenSCG-928-A07]|nr:HD domain-containing protein [Desulfosarcina sp. OttesenSCG-928-G17]MDL2330217.1 HD domain-containing protein [Desulfosarcina sp. OttesenSCG-928-A07]